MHKIPPISIGIDECIDLCTRGSQDTAWVERVQKLRGRIKADSDDFDLLAQQNQISAENVSGRFSTSNSSTKDDLLALYDATIERRSGRHLREAIIQPGLLRECPVCSQGVAGTLEHILPKSTWHYLSCAPSNLIPCCLVCNSQKGDTDPTQPPGVWHPYFDSIPNNFYFNCTLKILSGIYPVFVFEPVSDGTPEANSIRQFSFLYDLAKSFSTFASAELSNKWLVFRGHAQGGVESLRDYIKNSTPPKEECRRTYMRPFYLCLAKDENIEWLYSAVMESEMGIVSRINDEDLPQLAP